MATYKLIDKVVLTGTQTSVEFTGLGTYSSDYTDLLVKVSARSARTNDAGGSDGKLEFNGSTSGFSCKTLVNQSGAGSFSASTITFFVDSDNSTSNTYGNMEVYIPNFSSSNYKSVLLDAISENAATTAYQIITAGLWSNTNAITSMKFTDNNGGFLSTSSFYLYGIKNS